MSYLETVHYLLRTYETNDIINDANDSINHLRQYCFSDQEWADELAECALKRSNVFDDNVLVRIFIECLADDIRQKCVPLLVDTPIDTYACAGCVYCIDRRHTYHSQARARHAWTEE